MKDKIIEKVETILIQLGRVEAKLDAMIKAIHEYDDSEYGESSFEAFQLTNEYLSSLNEEEMERRMDIIGQNGNEGLHYDMGVENDSNNTQDNKRVDKKKNNPKQSPREGYTDATPFIKTRDRRKYYKPKNKG
jgi:hypothetical protein